MSQHSTPYAVPAVGMRKCMICPVCGDAFFSYAAAPVDRLYPSAQVRKARMQLSLHAGDGAQDGQMAEHTLHRAGGGGGKPRKNSAAEHRADEPV